MWPYIACTRRLTFENLWFSLARCRSLSPPRNPLPLSLSQDPEIQVLRVVNRMSQDYNSHKTCGYRDVLINCTINTALTRELDLQNHVCEVQLILKQFMLHKTLIGHKRYVVFRDKRCE